MSTSTASQPSDAALAAPPPVHLRCTDCGHLFPRPAEGAPRCRRCGSVRCRETVRQVAGEAVPAGASLDEDRFARVALWGSLITSQQFADAVEEQKARAEDDAAVPSLAEILVEKGHLRREDALAVLKVATTRTPDQWRNQFGQIALRDGYVTEAQLRECLELQTKLIMSSGSAPFLGHLLIERGYMTEGQALAILQTQKRRHIGILHQLQAILRPRSDLRAFVHTHPGPFLVAAFVLAVLGAGALGAWLHARATAPSLFPLVCDQCEHQLRAPADALARPCPRCGRGMLCTPLFCSQCRVTFPLKLHATEERGAWIEGCPLCGTMRHVTLPPGLEGLPVVPRGKAP